MWFLKPTLFRHRHHQLLLAVLVLPDLSRSLPASLPPGWSHCPSASDQSELTSAYRILVFPYQTACSSPPLSVQSCPNVLPQDSSSVSSLTGNCHCPCPPMSPMSLFPCMAPQMSLPPRAVLQASTCAQPTHRAHERQYGFCPLIPLGRGAYAQSWEQSSAKAGGRHVCIGGSQR